MQEAHKLFAHSLQNTQEPMKTISKHNKTTFETRITHPRQRGTTSASPPPPSTIQLYLSITPLTPSISNSLTTLFALPPQSSTAHPLPQHLDLKYFTNSPSLLKTGWQRPCDGVLSLHLYRLCGVRHSSISDMIYDLIRTGNYGDVFCRREV